MGRARHIKNNHTHNAAFTLVELLTVISILALLISILVPSLAQAKERARRVVCMNNVRQFMVTVNIYSKQYSEFLPVPGTAAQGGHTITLVPETRDILVDMTGTYMTLQCPYLKGPFSEPGGWRYDIYTYVIGYNYLVGHKDTPWPSFEPDMFTWKSPQTTLENPNLPLITELNGWVHTLMTWAPHGSRGAINTYAEWGSGGMSPEEIGATGGNIGLLDGSVFWRDISDMSKYRGSRTYTWDGIKTVW